MESEPIRDRASPLTSARRKPWDSISPLSALEDEPVRVSASSGKRTGEPISLGLECSVLLARKLVMPGASTFYGNVPRTQVQMLG
jgi:hypothetical protein